MFTGLVERLGTVLDIQDLDIGKRIVMVCHGLDNLPNVGSSISLSGCCLTVVDVEKQQDDVVISFDVVLESLQRTTLGDIKVGDHVNVEQSLLATSRLGGHFVQGHVDAVERIDEVGIEPDNSRRIRIRMDKIDNDTIVPKGSITVDGVSLTIAHVDAEWFDVVLIPTTCENTTLGSLVKGNQVNIETDILVRAVVQTIRRMRKN